jgi:hypothetical protein
MSFSTSLVMSSRALLWPSTHANTLGHEEAPKSTKRNRLNEPPKKSFRVFSRLFVARLQGLQFMATKRRKNSPRVFNRMTFSNPFFVSSRAFLWPSLP